MRSAIGQTPYRFFVYTEVSAGDEYLTISGTVFSATGGTVYRTHERVKLDVAEAELSLVEGAGVYLLRRNEGAELSLQANENLDRDSFNEDSRLYGAVFNARSANFWSEGVVLTGQSDDRNLADLEYSSLELSFDCQISLWEGRLGGVLLGVGARDFEESYTGVFSGRTELAIGTRTYSVGAGIYFGSINNGLLLEYRYEPFSTDDRSPDRFFSEDEDKLYDGEASVAGVIYRRTSTDWEAEFRVSAKQGTVDGIAAFLAGVRTDFDAYGIRFELDRRWESFGIGIFGATQSIEYQDTDQAILQNVTKLESSWIGVRLSYRLGG